MVIQWSSMFGREYIFNIYPVGIEKKTYFLEKKRRAT